MSINKGKVIWFLICPLLLVLFLIYFACVAYFYDPKQLFSEKYDKRYIVDDYEQRFWAKRIINNVLFDSVVLGSSMLTESVVAELNFANFINISYGASNWNGRMVILNYLFNKNKNIYNVITTYDGFWNFSQDINDFEFVYDSNLYKIFEYYLKLLFHDRNFRNCFFEFSYTEECIGVYIGDIKNYNVLRLNDEIELNIKILNMLQNKNYTNDFNVINNVKGGYFDFSNKKIENFINFIKKHQKTRFHIVIPPYPIMALKFNDYRNFLKYLQLGINEMIDEDNVLVYWFYDEDFVLDLRNYKQDFWHYQPHVNSRINKAINEGTNVITKENMDEYFDKFIKKVESYDIKAYEEALRLDIRE